MKNNHAIIKKGKGHDAGYKALLSHKTIVREESEEEWLKDHY